MPVTATITSKISVKETLATFGLTADNTLTRELGNNDTLNAGSTPPATKVACFELALTAGAGTIDLRALPTDNGGTVDGNGLKVQAIMLMGKTGNANPITVAVGASNGYNLAGADFSVALKAEESILLQLQDSAPDIDATHKILDVSGTGSQVLQVLIVMG